VCFIGGISMPGISVFTVISQRPSFMFGTEPAKEIEMAVNIIIEAANSFFNIGIPPFFEMPFLWLLP
jgi:hypothetical protein